MRLIDAIPAYLNARRSTHPSPDLLDSVLPYAADLEWQINVAQGAGELMAGKRGVYSDGVRSWANLRVPKDSNTEPKWDDETELLYPLDEHADAIGSSGWDWRHQQSLYLGFDFDSVTAHAKGVGVSDADLRAIRDAAPPWVEIRRSTSGGEGVHFYVQFREGIPCANHVEHAALARAVLGMMSAEVGFDFNGKLDCYGAILWVWRRRMGEKGFELLRAATRQLSTYDLPPNWRDHIEVVKGRRSKIRINGVEQNEDPFEKLAMQQRVVPLDDHHRALIQAIQESGFTCLWVPDHHLLQTHTAALQQLREGPEAQKLGLVGAFRTNSQGRNPGNPNCFLFPMVDGAWHVFRFSLGIAEDPTWTQDGVGWTSCYFNRPADLATAAKAYGGVEDPDKGGFVFKTPAEAAEAAKLLGQTDLDVAEVFADRKTKLKAHKDGRLTIEIERRPGDDDIKEEPVGWLAGKTKWTRVYSVQAEPKDLTQEEGTNCDHLVRYLMTPDGKDAGCVLRDVSGVWVPRTRSDLKMALQHCGMSKTQAEEVMGGASKQAWTIVNVPFTGEYPGARQWNISAAQYKCEPVVLGPDEAPKHPHWDMVYDQLGALLDEPLKSCKWAQDAKITTGAQYLRLWVACVLREPLEPLPYLFFWGKGNVGKSLFHESLLLLISKGIVKADRALTADFNGELLGAVVCVVEERDISKAPGAYARIKDWTTAKKLAIRQMRTDLFEIANTTHWVQEANEPGHCPLKRGDTRITVVPVKPLSEEAKIQYPKRKLMGLLEQEAPHFLRTLLDMELPPVTDRLRLEVIDTLDKRQLEDDNDPEAVFLHGHCAVKEGSRLEKHEVYKQYKDWANTNDYFEHMKPKSFGWAVMRVFAGQIKNTDKMPKTNKDCYTNLAWKEATA